MASKRQGVCRLDYCDRPLHYLRDSLCQSHYGQQRQGVALRPIKTRRASLADRNEAGDKWCSKGEHWLPVDAFAVSSRSIDGLQAVCRSCRGVHYYQANRASILEKRRVHLFGITNADFDRMLAEQGGRCLGCGTDAGPWHIDHNHKCCPGGAKTCGRCVRAILCGPCNNALGMVKDNPHTLRLLAHYLERHGANE